MTACALKNKKNRRLTTAGDDAIMTTGRDDAFVGAFPSEDWTAAYQFALDGGLFLFLVLAVASDLDRGEHKRDNHDD